MPHRTFNVRLIGFELADEQSLTRIFRLSEMRNRRYVAAEANAVADIWIVNGDHTSTRIVNESGSTSPCLLVVDQDYSGMRETGHWPRCPLCPNHECFGIKRPLMAVRVLRMLDTITVEQLGYTPELFVGSNEQPDSLVAPNAYRQSMAKQFQRTLNQVGDKPTEEFATSLRALVVDDSLAVRTQMQIQLESAGVNADFASSGEEALSMVAARRYNVVFLDVVMPGQDGFQVCRQIRRFERAPRIVMLTSKTSTLSRARGTLAGADAYLTKPMEPAELYGVLRKLFKGTDCRRGLNSDISPVPN